MMSDQNTASHGRVLVVGAGPAGLVAAITLARMGVRCLLVDRRRAPSSLPRATVLSLHTMELLRSWGLERRVQKGGHEVEWLMSLSRTLREAGSGDRVEVGYPTVGQSALISPSRPANVPQDHLEGVLLDHLRRLPAAQVRLGVRLEDIEQDRTGYRAVCAMRRPARSASNGPRSCSVPTARTAPSATCWAFPCRPREVTTRR